MLSWGKKPLDKIKKICYNLITKKRKELKNHEKLY